MLRLSEMCRKLLALGSDERIKLSRETAAALLDVSVGGQVSMSAWVELHVVVHQALGIELAMAVEPGVVSLRPKTCAELLRVMYEWSSDGAERKDTHA